MTFATHMGTCVDCRGWHYLYRDICYECREERLKPVLLEPGEAERLRELREVTEAISTQTDLPE